MLIKFDKYDSRLHATPYAFTVEGWPKEDVAPTPKTFGEFILDTLTVKIPDFEGDVIVCGMVNKKNRKESVKKCFKIVKGQAEETTLEKIYREN